MRSLGCLSIAIGFFAVQHQCVADPVSPELRVDSAKSGPAPGGQGFAVAASSSRNVLAAWIDQRFERGFQVIAARLCSSGALLDQTGILVSVEAANGSGDVQADAPAVAFDGRNFLIAWTEADPMGQTRIKGGRIDADSGLLLDPNAFDIAAPAASPSVAFDGSSYLVVWVTTGLGGAVQGRRFSPGGSPLDAAPFQVASGSSNSSPHVVFGADDYFVTWQDMMGIAGARIRRTGEIIDATPIRISPPNAPNAFNVNPAIAFDGTDFVVAWSLGAQAAPSAIVGTRVTPSGQVVDAMPIVISRPEGVQDFPTLTFDGQNVFAAWWAFRRNPDGSEMPAVWSARVAPSGTVVDPFGVFVALSGQNPPAASNIDGRDFVIAQTVLPDLEEDAAFADPRPGYVLSAYVLDGGAVIDRVGTVVSNAANDEENPRIAFDGANYLVVWQDLRGGRFYGVYAARISPTGMLLDSEAMPIAMAATGSQAAPGVAFGDGNYLVVWADGRQGAWRVYGARVSPAGAVMDPMGIPISPGGGPQRKPTVAWNGSEYLVAWIDGDIGAYRVGGTRLSSGGNVLDVGGLRISSGSSNLAPPGLASDGQGFLVAWAISDTVLATRVDSNGIVLDGAGIPVGTGKSPAIGFDGTNYLIAWLQEGSASASILATRVTSAGVVLAPTAMVGSSDGSGGGPSVAFDGNNYRVAWPTFAPPGADLLVAAVDPAAGVTQAATSIAQGLAPNAIVAPAGGGSGSAMIAYQRSDLSPRYMTNRVRVRLIGSAASSVPDGGPPAEPSVDAYCPALGPDAASMADGGAGAKPPGDGGCGCVIGESDSRQPGQSCFLLLAFVLVAVIRMRSRRAGDARWMRFSGLNGT